MTSIRRATRARSIASRGSWLDAVRFANALSRAESLAGAYAVNGVHVELREGAAGYRLPTEAEWEHAVRWVKSRIHHRTWTGSRDSPSIIVVTHRWVKENANQRLHPTCTKPANGFGLCDLTGNVREWVWDRHAAYPSVQQREPRGPDLGTHLRVIRGGSWNSEADEARVAYRHSQLPDYRSMSLGFRLIRPGRRGSAERTWSTSGSGDQ